MKTRYQQIEESIAYKKEVNEDDNYMLMKNNGGKIIGIISLFSNTDRKLNQTQFIILDETCYINCFDWSVCLITSINYN